MTGSLRLRASHKWGDTMSPIMQDQSVQGMRGGDLEHPVLAVLLERIARLTRDARKDLLELVAAVKVTTSDEERQEIAETMRELLFPERVGSLVRGPLPAKATAGVEKRSVYLGKRIRELREKKGLTQERLARTAHLPQSHISRLEVGKHSPSFKTLARLARALRCEIGDIDPAN